MSVIIINGTRIEAPDGASIVVGDNTITIGDNVVSGLSGKITLVIVEGNVGNVKSNASVQCRNVNGSVDAGGSVNCDNVTGDIDAGGSVNCGNVGGNIDAGGSVVCTGRKG